MDSMSGLGSVAEDPDHVTESFLRQGEQGEQAEARYTRTGHITLTPEPLRRHLFLYLLHRHSLVKCDIGGRLSYERMLHNFCEVLSKFCEFRTLQVRNLLLSLQEEEGLAHIVNAACMAL